MEAQIRRARPDEAETLTALMRRSKAFWGYSEEFMRLVHDQMKITVQQIENALAVCVLEQDERPLGFYHLKDKEGLCWMEDLFIEPDAMGKGYGKLLFDHALQLAQASGYPEMQWESDPNAEDFYLKMGANRIGAKPSLIEGRVLPQMRIMLK